MLMVDLWQAVLPFIPFRMALPTINYSSFDVECKEFFNRAMHTDKVQIYCISSIIVHFSENRAK